MEQDARIPASTSLDDWLDQLAQPTGAPGGGAASGVMLAISAGLLRMVAGYTPDDERAGASGTRLAGLLRDALRAAETDGLLSATLGSALAEPADAPGRDRRLRDAAVAAARSSAELGTAGIAISRELDLLAEVGNPHLAADLAVAAHALEAGLAGALTNLRANMGLVEAHRSPDDAVDGALANLEHDEERMSAARDTATALARNAAG